MKYSYTLEWIKAERSQLEDWAVETATSMHHDGDVLTCTFPAEEVKKAYGKIR